MDNPLQLGFVQASPRGQLDDDRSRCRLLLLTKQPLFRQRQVNPRRLHRGQRGDRPHQFPLQRATIVDLLGKIGHPEALLVKNFETDPAFGKAGAGQFDPGLIDLIGRNHDLFAAIFQPVRDLALLQPFNDGCGIPTRQVGEQQTVVGHPGLHDDQGEQDDADQRHSHQAQFTRQRPLHDDI